MTSRSDFQCSQIGFTDPCDEIAAAIVALQSESTTIEKGRVVTSRDGRPMYRFAPLSVVQAHLRPLLARHKLAIVQHPMARDGLAGVHTTLIHASGQRAEWEVWGPLDEHLSRDGRRLLSPVQEQGAAWTYIARYAWMQLCASAATDDVDTDALAEEATEQRITPPAPLPSPVDEAAETFRRQLFAALPSAPTLTSCGGDNGTWQESKSRYQAAAKMLLREWYDVGSSKEITADHAAGSFGRKWLSDPSNVSLAWDNFWSAAADAAEEGA